MRNRLYVCRREAYKAAFALASGDLRKAAEILEVHPNGVGRTLKMLKLGRCGTCHLLRRRPIGANDSGST